MAKQEKLTDQQTAFVCRGLSLQLHAGITLSDGLYLLAEDEQGSVAESFRQMGAAMDRGEEFADALEHSGCFPEYVCVMARIGQRSGKLEQTLQALYGYYDLRSRQKRQIKNAISYPAMVFVLMMVVVTVLLVKVLPVFDGVYASLGSGLTGIAGGLLELGQLLERGMPVLLAILTGLMSAAVCYWKLHGVRERINGWYQVRFGDRGIGRKINNARYAQAMALGLSSGLSLEESMELAQDLLKQIPGAARRGARCMTMLAEGADLAEAMAAAQLLPPAEGRMLAVGLRGGNGDCIMEEIARRLDRQAEEALEDAVAKIEPAMVLIASALVGVILLSVMLPLMNIMSTIG